MMRIPLLRAAAFGLILSSPFAVAALLAQEEEPKTRSYRKVIFASRDEASGYIPAISADGNTLTLAPTLTGGPMSRIVVTPPESKCVNVTVLENRMTAMTFGECKAHEPPPTPTPSPVPTPIPTVSPVPTPTPSTSPVPTPTPTTSPIPPGGPTITDVVVRYIRPSSATITWATDVKSTSQAEFGKTPTFGLKTRKWDARPVDKHEQVLQSLEPGTRYHFRVWSEVGGKASVSAAGEFTTAPAAPIVVPPEVAPLPCEGLAEKTPGPATLVVDSRDPECGKAGHPACKIPPSAPAGSVIEVHTGASCIDYQSKGAVFVGEGTSAQPVFLVGVNDGDGPACIKLANPFLVQGSQVVVKGFTFDRTQLRGGYNSMTGQTNGTCYLLRDNEVRDHPARNGLDAWGTDVMVALNWVHHNQAGGPSGSDQHGISVGGGSKRVWVFDNTMAENVGDGTQFCHGCTSPPEDVYLFWNRVHDNRENGIDLKAARRVFVIENEVWGHYWWPKGTEYIASDGSIRYVQKPTNSSDGSNCIVGSSGATADSVWLRNFIHDGQRGWRVEDACAPQDGTGPCTLGQTIFAGNMLEDNRWANVAVQNPGGNLSIFDNTMTTSKACFRLETGSARTVPLLRGNVCIVGEDEGGDKATSFWFDHENALKGDVSGNLFWRDGKPIPMNWGAVDYLFTDTADMTARFKGGKDNVIGPPGPGPVPTPTPAPVPTPTPAPVPTPTVVPSPPSPPPPSPPTIKVTKGIVYSVPVVNVDNKTMIPKLDTYESSVPGPKPWVILKHGGNGCGGSRDSKDMVDMATALVPHGFSVASIDYRLKPICWPTPDPLGKRAAGDAQADSHAAARFIRKVYGALVKMVVGLGYSSGAGKTMRMAFNMELLTSPGNTNPSNPGFDSSISVAGLIGYSTENGISLVDPGETTPTIFFCGGKDPYCQKWGSPLKEKLEANGARTEMHVYPGAGHDSASMFTPARVADMAARFASFVLGGGQ